MNVISPPQSFNETMRRQIVVCCDGALLHNLNQAVVPLTPDGVTPRAPSQACPTK